MKIEEMSLRQKLGQMLVTGLPGDTITPEWKEMTDRCLVGNVILFKYNQLERTQLTKLCQELSEYITKKTGIEPFITSDEEGGVVSRLPFDMASMPSAMAQASLGDTNRIRQAAKLTGCELRSVGINFNLAPVLDINNNPDNPVIGVRSYGMNAKDVCRYAMAAYEGYEQAGILTAGKHFPGHGDTTTDSHLALPVIHKDLRKLEELELIPFYKAIAKGIPAITIAHILFPSLEKEKVPATMSKGIITGLLRETLGFKGLIISDCLEMDAIQKIYGISKGAVEAVKAGMDLIFISRNHAEVLRTIEALEEAVNTGDLPMSRIDDAVGRILAYKKEYLIPAYPMEHKELEEMRLFAERFTEDTIAASLQGTTKEFELGENPLFLAPSRSQVTMAANLIHGDYNFAEAMQERFGGQSIVLGMDPDKEEQTRIRGLISGHSSIVFGMVNGNSHPAQLQLARILGEASVPLAIVALRNPFELQEIPRKCFSFALYEYSKRTVEIGMRFFRK